MFKTKLAWIAGLILVLIAQNAMSTTAATTDLPIQIPNFKSLNISALGKQLDSDIKKFDELQKTLLPTAQPTWEHTIQPLVTQLARVQTAWNLISLLQRQTDSKEANAVYDNMIAKVLNVHSSLTLNKELYAALNSIKNGKDFAKLELGQQDYIQQSLLQLSLVGDNLDAEKHMRYQEIMSEIQSVQVNFLDNLEQASANRTYFIPTEDHARLEGLPDSIINRAKQAATANHQDGWLLDYEKPCFVGVLSYARDRNLRETYYTAYATLASDQDPSQSKREFDNTTNIYQELRLQQELATLLGFSNYAEYALADHLAPSPQQTMQFLQSLASVAKPVAERQLAALQEYAAKTDRIDKLQPWDMAYYAESLKYSNYSSIQELSRQYFTPDKVVKNMLNVASILFDTQIKEVTDASTWDKGVKLYSVSNSKNQMLGYFYLDLYQRANKISAPNVIMYANRLHTPSADLLPVAVISHNLVVANPQQMSHDEVVQLFKLFGNALERILANAQYPGINGLSGAANDAIALSSEFMGKWAWQPAVIQDMTGDLNGNKMPANLFDSLVLAHEFDSGINLLQQLTLAIFDLRLRMNLPEDKNRSALEIYQQVQQQYSVLPSLPNYRLLNGLSSVFASTNASQNYAQLWADNLASDTFNQFLVNGLFSGVLGHKLRDQILEAGGSDSTLALFKAFSGREPDSKYMLQDAGIKAQQL